MKLGIVGSRSIIEYWDVMFHVLPYLEEDTIIVSGGAEGVDTIAEQIAREYGLDTIIHLPNKAHPYPARYFIRNELIVRDSDLLLAFMKTPGSPGTSHTIETARHLGVPYKVFYL